MKSRSTSVTAKYQKSDCKGPTRFTLASSGGRERLLDQTIPPYSWWDGECLEICKGPLHFRVEGLVWHPCNWQILCTLVWGDVTWLDRHLVSIICLRCHVAWLPIVAWPPHVAWLPHLAWLPHPLDYHRPDDWQWPLARAPPTDWSTRVNVSPDIFHGHYGALSQMWYCMH